MPQEQREAVREEWAKAAGQRGHEPRSVAPEIKKSTFIFCPKRLLFARGSWKAHYRPIIDPWLLVYVNFNGSGSPR